MATSIPDGWQIQGGDLGTEIDIDTTTFATGGSSVKFIGTGSNAAKWVSAWVPLPSTTAGASRPQAVSVNALLKASSSAGTSSITMVIETANSARSSISTSTVFASNLPSTNWVNVGDTIQIPGTPAWLRFTIYYTSNSAFNFWVDSVEVKQFPAGALYNDSTTGTFSATWATATLASGSLLQQSFATLSSNTIIVYSAGLYQISANVQLPAANYEAGDMFGIRLRFGDSAGTALFYRYGSVTTVHAAYDASTNNLGLTLATQELLVSDNNQSTTVPSQIKVELIQHTNTGTLKAYGDVNIGVARITDR